MHPYIDLRDKAYWKKAVSSKNMFDISDLWEPKFNIGFDDVVASYGSCFAQHFGKALLNRGYKWKSFESLPGKIDAELRKKYNYDIFSARTANIYTTSLLNQWLGWAIDVKAPDEVWEKGNYFIDPFRPTIEPYGFTSIDELIKAREHTISAFHDSVVSSNVFVFTLGLTESWYNKKEGYEYPLCPGTVGGEFDSEQHVFKNQGFEDVRQNLVDSILKIKQLNPNIKILLTVSPVPLVATNSGAHVLTATTYSKSVLRAVAGQIAMNHNNVDYFPSFEIISSTAFKSVFYEPNMREVNMHGVDFVMSSFFSCLKDKYGIEHEVRNDVNEVVHNNDVVCEEELMEVFSR